MVTATRRLAPLMMPASERGHVALAGRAALAQRVGGIADHGRHALRAQLPEAGLVDRRADQRRGVDLPVAGMEGDAVARADGDGIGLRDRVRHGDELEIEGAHVEAAVEGHLLDGQLHLAAELRELGLEHRRRERGCIDRHPEPRPQLDDGADVVLVRVGQHQAGKCAALLLDEAQVGQDHVDAGVVLALREGDAEIDHQPLARIGGPKAVEIAVHADLADAAERHEHELAGRGFVALAHGRSPITRAPPPAGRAPASRRRR